MDNGIVFSGGVRLRLSLCAECGLSFDCGFSWICEGCLETWLPWITTVDIWASWIMSMSNSNADERSSPENRIIRAQGCCSYRQCRSEPTSTECHWLHDRRIDCELLVNKENKKSWSRGAKEVRLSDALKGSQDDSHTHGPGAMIHAWQSSHRRPPIIHSPSSTTQINV